MNFKSIYFKNSLALIGISLGLLHALPTQAGDGALSLSAIGGAHGNYLINYAGEGGPRTKVSGTEHYLGLGVGIRAGVSATLYGKLWAEAIYQGLRMETYTDASPTTATVDHKESIQIPVMYRKAFTSGAIGLGAFYQLPVTDNDRWDWGLVIKTRIQKGAIPLFAQLGVTLGLRFHDGEKTNNAFTGELGFRLF